MPPVAYVLRNAQGEILALFVDEDTVHLDTPVRRAVLADAERLNATIVCMAVP